MLWTRNITKPAARAPGFLLSPIVFVFVFAVLIIFGVTSEGGCAELRSYDLPSQSRQPSAAQNQAEVSFYAKFRADVENLPEKEKITLKKNLKEKIAQAREFGQYVEAGKYAKL